MQYEESEISSYSSMQESSSSNASNFINGRHEMEEQRKIKLMQ